MIHESPPKRVHSCACSSSTTFRASPNVRFTPKSGHWIEGAECPLSAKSGHLSLRQRCPLYPRKQTFSEAALMSAKCQKRTFELTSGSSALSEEEDRRCYFFEERLTLVNALIAGMSNDGRLPRGSEAKLETFEPMVLTSSRSCTSSF